MQLTRRSFLKAILAVASTSLVSPEAFSTVDSDEAIRQIEVNRNEPPASFFLLFEKYMLPVYSITTEMYQPSVGLFGLRAQQPVCNSLSVQTSIRGSFYLRDWCSESFSKGFVQAYRECFLVDHSESGSCVVAKLTGVSPTRVGDCTVSYDAEPSDLYVDANLVFSTLILRKDPMKVWLS